MYHMCKGSDVWILWRVGGAFWIDADDIYM